MSDLVSVLHSEHELLHASFASDDMPIPVLSYDQATLQDVDLARSDAAYLCDLSGLFVSLVEGHVAEAFMSAACAGTNLAYGTAAFEAVLAGDGAVVSIPLVMRSGQSEYVLFDGSPRGAILAEWLSFLGHIEKDGIAPYADVTLSDARDVHAPLLLVGKAATSVLSDYLSSSDELPLPGSVRELRLDDRIPCICLALPFPRSSAPACYLLLVPPPLAPLLWRSFLSFPDLVPIGRCALKNLCNDLLPWTSRINTADRLVFHREDLKLWELLRDNTDYVGAQALYNS